MVVDGCGTVDTLLEPTPYCANHIEEMKIMKQSTAGAVPCVPALALVHLSQTKGDAKKTRKAKQSHRKALNFQRKRQQRAAAAALNNENAAAPLEVGSAKDAAQVGADASEETKYGETAGDVCIAALNNENAAAPTDVISAKDAAQVSADASKETKETKGINMVRQQMMCVQQRSIMRMQQHHWKWFQPMMQHE